MNPLLDSKTVPGFHNVGRSPHDCTIDELEAGGFTPHSSTKAIRRMCMACMGNSAATVADCGSIDCALWPWRLGTRPDAWKGLQAGPRYPVTGEEVSSFSSDSTISENPSGDTGGAE